MSQPKYAHDCDTCRFLATVTMPDTYTRGFPETTYDLWFCARCDGGSVIARRSDDGSDYMSSPIAMVRMQSHPALFLTTSIIRSEQWWADYDAESSKKEEKSS